MYRISLRRVPAATFSLLGLLSALGSVAPARSDELAPAIGVRADDSGGGPYVLREPPYDHLTPLQRQAIWTELRHNLTWLQQSGRLAPPTSALLPTPLAWPLRASGIADPGVHGIANFVDQNESYPNAVRDWNCGARSYDTTAGYNHSGTDIFLWPFPWRKMANNQVQVVAAAAGTIVNRSDGNSDQSCSFNNNNWNAIYVRHADGSIAWYGHLKRGSLTTKGVGATVSQGEFLGVVGSSGNSTGPHLHLELYDPSGKLNDPFKGACNTKNSSSWWAAQRPYSDSAVNKLTAGSAPPVFPSCPGTETTNEKTTFRYGEPAVFTAYYRDQLSSQTSTYSIYKPDGSIYSSWTHHSTAAYNAASYWYWSWTRFAPTGPSGTWRFQVTFNGVTTTTPFTVSP